MRNLLVVLKSYWRVGLVFFLAYLIFLLTMLPANFVLSFIPTKNFQLVGVSGSAWSGQVEHVQFNNLSLGKLEWDLSILSLLIGDISADVKFQDKTSLGEGNICVSWGGAIELNDWQARLPAQTIVPLLQGLPVTVEGYLSAKIIQLEFEPNKRFALDGNLLWRGAAVKSPTDMSLGDLQVNFFPDGEGSKGVLTDKKGPLSAEGVVKIQANGQYRLDAQLATRASAQPSLQQALSFLGRKDSKGKVTLKRNGRFRF